MSSHPSQIGPYAITEKIGAGGMGTVYLAKHNETGQVAAVKVLTSAMAREAGFVARFEREIDALRRLTNPHIIKLFDSGADAGTYYYAMEYVEGETLADLIKREKQLPWREVIDIGVQICSALKAAHDAGIIHRDIKPSNLLLDHDGVVKLTDFGIAQVFAASKLTKTGGIVGTAEFMSPEQADGRRASKQSDLYSLGAVLYALLTGRPPFSGSTSSEVIHKHKYGQFERPSLLVPEIPSWLETVVCQLLEKEPEKRFPDAFVLSRQLELVKKRVELSMRDTMTSLPSQGDVGPTVAEHPEADFGGATMMKELVGRELEELHGEHPVMRFLNQTWVLVAMLVLVILGGFYFFRDDRLPAEERFQAAKQVLDGEESDAWIAAGEQMRSLVADDADKWQDQAAPYLDQVELYKLKSRLNRQVRKHRRNILQSEPMRLLLLAQNYREQGDLTAADDVLTALTVLLAENEQHQALREMAAQLKGEIADERTELTTDAKPMLAFALERADQLIAEGDIEQAREIWQTVTALYAREPSAQEFVERSRQGLKNHVGPAQSAAKE